jgi:hypothetical protein
MNIHRSTDSEILKNKKTFYTSGFPKKEILGKREELNIEEDLSKDQRKRSIL